MELGPDQYIRDLLSKCNCSTYGFFIRILPLFIEGKGHANYEKRQLFKYARTKTTRGYQYLGELLRKGIIKKGMYGGYVCLAVVSKSWGASENENKK